MAIALTTTDLEDLMVQAEDQGETLYQTNGIETQSHLPKRLGEGGDRLIQLRGGLTLHIRQAKLWQDVILEQQHDEHFPITAKFYLSGASRVKTDHASEIESTYEESAGYHYLYYLPNLTEIEEWRAAHPVYLVMIYASLDYFRAFSETDGILPQPLQQLLMSSPRFHQPLGKMPPMMQQTLQHMIHCPYQGAAQQLYLESKALELLALQFADLGVEYRGTPKQYSLTSDDLERVKVARDILVDRLCHPPSLIELAHQVGLNDRKLKQGFRYLFDTTVFGYLRDRRMQQAQLLLRSCDVTIAQVAIQVGYRNPEAFSTAFRRAFAVSPKAYQLGRYR